MTTQPSAGDGGPWYKDAIIYEVHVKAFFDSAGDGIGDFRGLTSKLDYIKELGVNAIWLLPFYPSPLKDDGYDISDYMNVNPAYGSLGDFEEFLREAHARGLRVFTELVLNHTSDQHPWFQTARRAEPGSDARNFYVWSSTPNRYTDARIIFGDFEVSNWTWDTVAQAYYWHRFYSHQPDLNFDSPQTQKKMLEVVSYWLKMGVDGLRLDAVPYLFEREGTNCENLPETHDFLKRLRAYVDASLGDRAFLAEANQWPSEAATYFGKGDECHMTFHFPLMPRMFMAIQLEDRFPIIDILEQTPAIPENCQWALFLRNHDELTLEMVTDEERDYMYRVYGKDKQARINLGIRRRLAPLLDNDRKKIELMNLLLFTLPGTPVIYYGDEIGMGDNYYLGDRNGVRTPMQWSADLNAGFSRTNPQKLYLPVIIEPKYHYETVNVENQQNDPGSLLVWMKKLIAVRKRFRAFGRGSIQFLFPDNYKILAFRRELGDEKLLVVANLSKYPQAVDLDLSKSDGFTPQEIFGGMVFPIIGKTGYRLTFTSYGYYVFSLAKTTETSKAKSGRIIQELSTGKRVPELFKGKLRDRLEEEVLPPFLWGARWFTGKGRVIERVRIRDVVTIEPSQGSGQPFYLMVVDVYYSDGLPEAYLLPVAYAPIERGAGVVDKNPATVIAKVVLEKNEKGIIFDGVYDPLFREELLRIVIASRTNKGSLGEVTGTSRSIPLASQATGPVLGSKVLESEQSNTSIVYEDRLILKLVRRVEEGVNPEMEIGDVLTKQSFPYAPALMGDIKYLQFGSEPAVIAILEEYVRNEGEATSLFKAAVASFLEGVSTRKDPGIVKEVSESPPILSILSSGVSEPLVELMGHAFLERVQLLGKRTAEFHLALARETEDPAFRPEPFTQLYQTALAQSMSSYTNRVLGLAGRHSTRDETVQKDLADLLVNQGLIGSRFNLLRQKRITALKTRTHGDYHLGQVLNTGKDFEIIDYEGEPSRSLSDRRLKRSPMKDVAGMIRSFHYAAYSDLLTKPPTATHLNIPRVEDWIDAWYRAVAATFLRSYLDVVSGTGIFPGDAEAFAILFETYLLERAIYELGYELNSRPEWTKIPLRGIRSLLGLESKNPPGSHDEKT